MRRTLLPRMTRTFVRNTVLQGDNITNNGCGV
jgi:hypothetical protein